MALTLKYQVEREDRNKPLGDFLKQRALSKKAIVTLKHRGGKICVNSKEQTTRFILQVGDVVAVTFPDEAVSRSLLPIEMDIQIIYEDDFLLVIDKKEGVPVMPTGEHHTTLANGILAYYQAIGLNSTVHFVNRLDKDTSGLLIISKYRHIHHLMTVDIRRLTRKYYALVNGFLKEPGSINAKIARSSVDSVKRMVHPSGQHALTHYEIIQHFNNTTLIRCILETGRTHQIRVHMSYIGHPILKDSLYGSGKDGDMQLLHSYFLEFNHPMTGEKLTFETGVPKRFLVNY